MRREVLCVLFAGVIAATAAPSAQAADSDAEGADFTDLSLEELMDVDVVVTASRHEQEVRQAPSSVTIVTAGDIRAYGYRTLGELLDGVRGFYVTYDRNYSYLGVRGFLRPGDYNTRVLLLVNGSRINENIYSAAYLGTAAIIDVDLIDRVEIVRGPSSSLYGTGALFAVVNVITRHGRDLQGAEASAEVASYDTLKGRFTYATRRENGLEVLLSGTLYDSAGPRLFFEEFDSPETNNGSTTDDDDASNQLFGLISYGDFSLQAAYARREKMIPTAPWETLFDAHGTFTVDAQGRLDLTWMHAYPSELEALARLSYGWYNYAGEYPWDASEAGDLSRILVNTDFVWGRWYGGEAQLSKPVSARHRLTVGAEVQNNYRQDQLNFDEVVYLDDQRSSVNWGVYAQDEWMLADALIVNAGVRHDHFETFGGSTNPRLALIYAAGARTTLKFLYGEAFRAPSVYELYYEDYAITQRRNAELGPETITTYEVVLEQVLSKALRLTVAGFRYELDDLINQVEDPDDGLLFFMNIDQAESHGVEFELERAWRSGARATASYSYQETTNSETGARLTNSPRHLAKFKLRAPLAGQRLSTGLEVRYTGTRLTLGGNEADDFVVANLTLVAAHLADGLSLSASIYNVFDTRYGHPGSEEHIQDIIDQDGRSFRLKLVYRF
ncbi:MAG: TonB-dependent receptor [Verrucomicrobia bacterium]|nr:TonB-dependent receptor [Verrucomicrobiota bacterium]